MPQLHCSDGFTPYGLSPYTASEDAVALCCKIPVQPPCTVALLLWFTPWLGLALTQDAAQKPADKPVAQKTENPAAKEKAENPAQIELLETKIRFETNGDSRKEVHTRVRINSEVGARQFARLNFDFNRSFESVEIPFVRITHANGGTADILPSAITDQPNPAVVNAPAYQDVRVKSVRILGLEPGDTLEYRVITTVSHHPLAPDFWLDHSFDRSGMVSREIFELDLPATPKPEIRINPTTPASTLDKSGEGKDARITYFWERPGTNSSTGAQDLKASQDAGADVALSTQQWEGLSIRLAEKLAPGSRPLEKIATYPESIRELSRTGDITPQIAAKATELTRGIQANKAKLEAIFDFISQKIATIGLPLGATGFLARPANDILTSGYATAEDKFVLFDALAAALKLRAEAVLTGYCDAKGLPRLSVFKHLLISAGDGKDSFWLDPSLEVAPFGMTPANSGKCAFVLNRTFFVMDSTDHEWQPLDRRLPFTAHQRVAVEAVLTTEGKLNARVHYSMRGDNELILRIAFHKAPKEQWKEVAQLLALSDGFRGKVTSVTASDPHATKEPFTLEYEIEEAKFVDWSKKPLRIPALLPQIGMPELPAKPVVGAAAAKIELGTPLEVETRATLHLPPGITVRAPTGTSVHRDYATFASQYSSTGLTVTASRHIRFLKRELPVERAADYSAFLHAVQSDASQDFSLERAEASSKTRSAAPEKQAPPR